MLYQILDKLEIILLLSLILRCLEVSGFITYITKFISNIKSVKSVILFWFLIGALVSSVFTDLTTAAILLPLLISYINTCGITKNKELLIASLVFGICSGGDITMYGGGDNLVAISLFESEFGYQFTNLMWFKYFLPPTLIIMVIIVVILFKFSTPEHIEYQDNNIYHIDILTSIILLIGIVSVFFNIMLLTWVCLLFALLKLKIGKEILLKVPYKAMFIWTVCFIIGKFIGGIFEYLPYSEIIENHRYAEFIIAMIASFMTIFCTNTMTASALIGITYSLFGANLPIIMLIIKSINVGYLTVYHNTCLSLANGYGLSQKTLFKLGIWILIPQILVNVIWYLILIL